MVKNKCETMVKNVSTTRKCKDNKVRQGVGRRCVKPCVSPKKRVNYKCVNPNAKARKPRAKSGEKIFNKISKRYVKKDGEIGRWIQGLTDHVNSLSYEPDMSYEELCRWIGVD